MSAHHHRQSVTPLATELRDCRSGTPVAGRIDESKISTTMESTTMSTTQIESLDHTVHLTNEWLRDISERLGDNRRHAHLALRGTLHALRDFLPIDELAHLSAQLPTLVRGIYFEGWDPSDTPADDRSREAFLGRVEQALERALWNE